MEWEGSAFHYYTVSLVFSEAKRRFFLFFFPFRNDFSLFFSSSSRSFWAPKWWKEGKFYRLLIFFTPHHNRLRTRTHTHTHTHTHALNNNHESSNHGIRENGRETRVFNVFLFFFDEVQNFLFLVDFDFVVVVVEAIQETPPALQEV